MMLAFLLSAALVATVPAPEQSAPFSLTGKILLQDCQSPPGATGDAFCTVYTAAFSSGAGAALAGSKSGWICVPDGFTGGQAREVFVRMMGKHPELLSRDIAEAMGIALALEFPCPKSN